MIKINKFTPLLLGFIVLTSCGPIDTPFDRVPFDRVENGQLIEISGEQLYNLTITRSTSLAVLYSVDGCASCKEAKQQLKNYAESQHCNTYWINLSLMGGNKEDYNYIVEATGYAGDAYKFPEYDNFGSLNLPMMDIFAYQGVFMRTNYNFIDYLLDYTTVKDA